MSHDTVVDTSKATIFQIEALAFALEHRNFADAAADMGFRDKYRLIKAVERLADNLQLDGLVGRLDGAPILPVELSGLREAVRRVRGSLADFEREATALRTRTVILRCLAYPSMVSIFLAEAVRRLEIGEAPGVPRSRVHFVDMESRNRVDGGSAIMRALQSGLVDVAVGPRQRNIAHNVGCRPLYSWKMVAALHREHSLWAERFIVDEVPHIRLDSLAGYPLLVSPLSHQTRTLLEEHQGLGAGFDIELQSSNTEARVALGRFGRRVPLVATDALEDPLYDSEWPIVSVLTDDGSLLDLGDVHMLYWREDLSEIVEQSAKALLEHVYNAASVLRHRPGGALERVEGH